MARWSHRTILERLEEKYIPEPMSGCWIWTAAINSCGYGSFNVNGEICGAHNILFRELGGVIPQGFELDHKCRNRACVNPHHLEVVTHQINAKRGLMGILHKPKTICSNGHQLSDETIYLNGRERVCLICKRTSWRRAQAIQRQKRKLINHGGQGNRIAIQ